MPRFSRMAPAVPLAALVVAGILPLTEAPASAAPPTDSNATNYYVSPTGSDSDAGSSTAPFKTPAGAQRAARVASQAGKAVHVWFAGGTYYLDQTLSFDAQDSGTVDKPVTYSGFPGERAVLSGGRRVSATWTDIGNGIKTSQIGTGLDFDGLQVNGTQQVLARYPNFDPDAKVLGGVTSMSTLNSRSAGWANPASGLLRALHVRGWGGNSAWVTGRSNGALTFKEVGDNNRGHQMDPAAVLVENIREELDAANEWFYDKATGVLYLKPAAGVDLATATIETAERTELVRIDGASATARVHDLAFGNLTFANSHRSLFNTTYENLQLGDWAVARAGAVHLKNTERIRVYDSAFDHVGGNGVFIDGYNSAITVTKNQFRFSGASDVQVVGAADAVREHSTWDAQVKDPDDLAVGPQSENYPRDITISSNSMADMGRFEKQSAGVNISMASRVTVSHNTVHGSPRSCINVNDGTWGGHLIEFNDIFDCVKETSDHGPINAWGRDRFWPIAGPSLNSTAESDADQRAIAKIDVYQPIVISNNRVQHTSEWAIDLDDGSSNYVLKNNLLLNAGIKLRDGFFRTVTNNILVNGQVYEQVSHRNNGDDISHNIVLGGAPYNIHSTSHPADAKYTADENLFWNNGGTVAGIDGTWHDNYKLDVNSKVADPQFVGGSPWSNPAMTDYSVRPGSPALGLKFVNFPMDQFGTGRPGEATPGPAAFPVTDAKPSIKDQKELFLGATAKEIKGLPDQSATGLPDQDGLYLVTVPSDSLAYVSGLREGDVIRAVGSTQVTDRSSFWRAYNAVAPGATVVLDVWRTQNSGTKVTVTKPETPQRYNDTSGFQYDGPGWQWYYSEIGGKGSLVDDLWGSKTLNDSFTYTFNGSGVDILGPKYSDQGLVEFYVDGVSQGTVDTRSSTRQFQQVIFKTRNLPRGLHAVRGVMRSGQYFLVDGATVYAPATVNDGDVAIKYSGAWIRSSSRPLGDLLDDVHYTRTNGDKAAFTFTGSGIEVLSERFRDQGEVEVFVDGVSRGRFDTSSATRQLQQIIFADRALAAGDHTIEIVKRSGTYALLDGFRVYA